MSLVTGEQMRLWCCDSIPARRNTRITFTFTRSLPDTLSCYRIFTPVTVRRRVCTKCMAKVENWSSSCTTQTNVRGIVARQDSFVRDTNGAMVDLSQPVSGSSERQERH